MVESDLRRYFKINDEPAPLQIHELGEEISWGIKIEKSIGERITSDVADEMIQEIAILTYYSSSYAYEHPLQKTTAHENSHIFQYFHFPKTMEKQAEVAASLGLSPMEKKGQRNQQGYLKIFFKVQALVLMEKSTGGILNLKNIFPNNKYLLN